MATKKLPKLNIDLKYAILAAGKTQRALARRLRMDETRLSRIVRGQAQPFAWERVALAKALERLESDLFRPRRAA